MKNCLIVLGMHRSGTSAFTGILDLAGVNLGTKMLETQSDNPKGFFENKYVVLANDCILESFDSSWDDTFPLPPNWPSRFDNSQLLDDVRSFLRTDIIDEQLSALKDPRMCRLLPFWLPLLAEENITPHFALVIRNPLEIADSLQSRNGFSTQKSLVLWMQYMLEAERNTRHLPRGIVRFESVLHEPQSSIEKVFCGAGLAPPDFSDVSKDQLAQFLDQNMRHHEVPDDELDTRCHKVIADYYRLLCKISESEPTAEDFEMLDELVARFKDNQGLFYNKDIILNSELSKEKETPPWYQAKLNRIRAQFDADKIFREYRYLANTEHLYQDRNAQLVKFAKLQQECSDLRSEISNLQNEIANLQTELLTPHITISRLRDEIASGRDENSTLREEISTQTSKIADLQHSISTQLDEISILQSTVATRATEISTLQNDISGLQNNISFLEQTRLTLQNVIAAQKNVIAAQKAEASNRQLVVADQQHEIEKQQSRIEIQQLEIAKHQHEIVKQQQTISAVSEDLDALRHDHVLLNDQLNHLEGVLIRIHATLAWRLYRKYQRTVDVLFPPRTFLRRGLQRFKHAVAGNHPGKDVVVAQSVEHPQPDRDNVDEAEVMETSALQEETNPPEVSATPDSPSELAPELLEETADREETSDRQDNSDHEEPVPVTPAHVSPLDTAAETHKLAIVSTKEPTVTASPEAAQSNDDAATPVAEERPAIATEITTEVLQADNTKHSTVVFLRASPKPDSRIKVSDPVTATAPETPAPPSPQQTTDPDGPDPVHMEETSPCSDPQLQSGSDSREQALAQPPLSFQVSDEPNVSIIIPVFNNWSFTYKCLNSLYEHTEGSYELIVVDNNSTDETPQKLAAMRGIQVITNETNEVFVNACNQAARNAKGKYLLFLNNDTEVSPGWLDAMLAPFSDSSTGIVGAKLIYPDGRLQEAGGIIWADGNGCNYGHGDDPSLPQYSYRKAVDYCSGACLMIPLTLWNEIGGFDERYAPAYYEDTDLCFAVRALNYKVIFQPAAQVIHFGGASAGKETSSGYKRFQEVNRHKFIEKWRDVLERDHVLSSAGLFNARERNSGKRILIIDHQVPTFDRDSGSLRMLSMLRILLDMGYKVSFWPDNPAYDPRYTRTLQDLGIETYYGELNFREFIQAHGNQLDVVIMSRPTTAKKYLNLVKKYSTAKTVFDTVDLHFVREQRRRDLEVQRWKNLEFFLAEEADATLVVSSTEKDFLADEEFAHKVSVVSNIHNLEPCVNGFEERHGLMFIGSFAHPPNEEGIIWFIEYILPLIKKKIPDVHLTIVGSDPTERLLSMANESVTVVGYVEDVSEYFSNCKVFVSPLLHGAGVKGKIGQSFSYGLPVVTTYIGAEGMQLTDGHNVLISDSETEFANNVVALYQDKFLWQKLSTNCRQVIKEQFSTDTIRTALTKILEPGSLRKEVKPMNTRPVIVHCHLFKNAGTTLDWSLQRQFGSQFIDHRDDDQMRRGAAYLKPYLESNRTLSAISSHHVRFPLPVSEQFQLLPLISLRHPIERARSVYDFERRQDADTPGAIQAKKLSFAEYVRWRMQPDVAPTIRNFHCSFCTSNFDSEIGERAYQQSVALLIKTPLLVIVERYDESMLLLEHQLERYFPGIDLSYIRQNETFGRETNLLQRIQSIDDDLGPELTHEFREKNHWDMRLYENALALLGERLGALGNFDRLMHDLQSRCRLLSVATLPNNPLPAAESHSA